MALIAALNTVALIVIVPIGLSLTGIPGTRRLLRWWPPVGALAAIAVWLPRGAAAVVLAAPYLMIASTLAVVAVAWVVRGGVRTPGDVAMATALVAPTVAASALLAERAGVHLFGFDLRVLALTVAHFHAAGFAAALIASLSAGRADATTDADPTAHAGGQIAAGCVPLGLSVVFAGFFTSDWVELAGTAILTAGMWLIAWATLRLRGRTRDRLARALFLVAALVPFASMLLALDWALGRAAGLPHPDVNWMAATHGLANLLGFAMCGLLAWRKVSTKDGADGGVPVR